MDGSLVLNIGNDSVPLKLIVCELASDDGIIGLPDLRCGGFNLRLDKTKLYFGEHELPLGKAPKYTPKNIAYNKTIEV